MHYEPTIFSEAARQRLIEEKHTTEQLLEMLHQDCERLTRAMKAVGLGCAYADVYTPDRKNAVMTKIDRDRLIVTFDCIDIIFEKLTGKPPKLRVAAEAALEKGEDREDSLRKWKEFMNG